jgi:hypothetical protein
LASKKKFDDGIPSKFALRSDFQKAFALANNFGNRAFAMQDWKCRQY